MIIDDKLIAYLEDLSCLTLSDEEKSRLKKDMNEILSAMKRLSEPEAVGRTKRSHPFDNVNAFREDEVKASFDRRLILQNAPVQNDEMFIAPKTVEPT